MPDDQEPFVPPEKMDYDQIPMEERLARFDERVVPFVRPPSAEGDNSKTAGKKLLMPLSALLGDLKAQDWLIKRIIERGALYTLTAHPNVGKTALAILLALLVGARDGPLPLFGQYRVKRGKVAYLIGEADSDTGRRMFAHMLSHGITDVSNIQVTRTAFHLGDEYERLKVDAEAMGGLDLVIVDTASTFFGRSGGMKENENREMNDFADKLRALTRLPGEPAVLVLCHPTKGDKGESNGELLPRGASALWAAIDTNLTLERDEGSDTIVLHHGKIRSMPFDPIKLAFTTVEHESFKDTDGDMHAMKILSVIGAEEQAVRAKQTRSNEDKILRRLVNEPSGRRQVDLAREAGLEEYQVSRLCKQMLVAKWIKKGREGAVVITDAGRAALSG